MPFRPYTISSFRERRSSSASARTPTRSAWAAKLAASPSQVAASGSATAPAAPSAPRSSRFMRSARRIWSAIRLSSKLALVMVRNRLWAMNRPTDWLAGRLAPASSSSRATPLRLNTSRSMSLLVSGCLPQAPATLQPSFRAASWHWKQNMDMASPGDGKGEALGRLDGSGRLGLDPASPGCPPRTLTGVKRPGPEAGFGNQTSS